MIVKRHDNCARCKTRIVVTREILETVDMFNPTPKGTITPEIKKQLLKFREEKLFCERCLAHVKAHR